jgi:two-component system response regulator FixJ
MRPDRRGCVLLDVRLPDGNGLDVLQELMARGIRLPVIMITAYADVPLAVAAMRAGAADFLEKPYPEQALLASIHNALRSDAMAAASAADIRSVNARLAKLTPREREVLDRLLAGRQNKQTARDLGISPRTVEIHRSRVMEKMGATSLSHLVRLVLRVRANGDGTEG